MVTVLFLNVTYNVTMDTFSLPRHVFIVARLLWPSAMRKVEGGGGGGGRRGGRRGRGAGGKERGDGSGKDGKGGGTGMHLKTRMQDSLKDLSKSSKKWSGMLSRSVGGMRRGFSSSENLLQHRRIDHLVMQGKRCDAVCDSSGAVDAFRTAIALRPDDPELLVSLAKSLSDRIFEKDIFNNLPLARAICLEAAEISRRAITLKPCHAEAHLCLGAALGRLAMWSDNREKVDLSRAIKDECEEAIRLDAVNDLAMHVLGRYEHQMAGLGRIVRTLVRVVYGGALAPGTLQEAENLFRRAIAIRPRRLIHRVELGKLLIDRGRKDEALIELELAVTLPREDINSEHERADAQELLKKHWGKVAVIPTFEDPPPTPPLRMPRRSADRSRVSLDALDQPGKST
jgi:Flp pilus assembly protein TadD